MNFSLKGYRTILINAAAFVASVLAVILAVDGTLGGMISISATGASIIAALSGINLVLRYLSDSPVFNAESKASTEIKGALADAWASGDSLVDAVQDVLEGKIDGKTV